LLERRPVWDLPTRIFHWSFAVSVVISMLIVYGKKYLTLHIIFGSLAFSLLIGRVIWGIVGTKYVKFISFLKSKKAIKNEFSIYSDKSHHIVGHPPVAGYVMLTMMLCGLCIGISGWILYLSSLDENSKEIVFNTHEVTANILLIIAFIHIQGVFLHTFLHRDGIVMGMLNGKRPAFENEQIGKLTTFQRVIAIIWFTVSLVVVFFLIAKSW
jgi:cytochrome b